MENQKNKKIKNHQKKISKKLSLYPLEFDEALKAILLVQPGKK